MTDVTPDATATGQPIGPSPEPAADPPADPVVERYSGLARLAQAGGIPIDYDADDCGEVGQACFGAAAYTREQDWNLGGVPEAALRASLGCGNPLAVADLRPGETVLDLGSGGGLDVLLSARRVGSTGTAYGLDASEQMLELARANATNVRFLHGRIEDIPLPDAAVDVIISNCVINLSADKPRVLAEAYRVLRPGGRLGISDVIADHGLDADRRAAAEARVGCARGTLTADQYELLLTQIGFTGIRITTTSDAGDGLHTAIIQAHRP